MLTTVAISDLVWFSVPVVRCMRCGKVKLYVGQNDKPTPNQKLEFNKLPESVKCVCDNNV